MPRTPKDTTSSTRRSGPLPPAKCKTEDVDEPLPDAIPGPSNPPRIRRHACPRCNKLFTTNGHLKRHVRIHMGDKHKCPFPGCETRCSRKDNLQQHYKTHLAFYTPRTVSKSAPGASAARRQSPQSPISPISDGGSTQPPSPSDVDSPPTLDDSCSSQSSGSSSFSSPPETPPQLEQATLSTVADRPCPQPRTPPMAGHRLDSPQPSYCESLRIPWISHPKPRRVDPLPSPRDVRASVGDSPLAAGPPLVHPIPRISQPRSCLLDHASHDAYESRSSLPVQLSTCEQSSRHRLLCDAASQQYLYEPPSPVAYVTQPALTPRRPLLEPLDMQSAIHGFDELSNHLASSQCYQPYYSQFDELRYPTSTAEYSY